VRQVDAAPTAAHLLGIPPPAHATGRALPLD
jgi:arylsulfatase A-like enzyme